MEIVLPRGRSGRYLVKAMEHRPQGHDRAAPILVDQFLDDADRGRRRLHLATASELVVCGVMEHIEEAGIHCGDSACALPPYRPGHRHRRRDQAAERRWPSPGGVGVRGLMNVQYAVKDDLVYVLEVNPRASRTVPFVSKATAVPVAKAAARVMVGQQIRDLREQGILPASGDGGTLPVGTAISVKEAVLPFGRVPRRRHRPRPRDALARARSWASTTPSAIAFAKSQEAAYAGGLPTSGTAFVSLANRDKRAAIFPIKRLADLGFRIVATRARRRCCGATESASRNCESSTRGAARPESRRPSTRSWPATSS